MPAELRSAVLQHGLAETSGKVIARRSHKHRYGLVPAVALLRPPTGVRVTRLRTLYRFSQGPVADHTADGVPVQPLVDRRHGHLHGVRRLRSARARLHIGNRRNRAVLRGRQVRLPARVHGARVGQPV